MAIAVSDAEYFPTIRDLPTTERPRERLLRYGPGSLSTTELLAILLRTGVKGESALAVGQRLLSRFSGLRGIAGAALAELSAEKGVSAAKYCQLMAAMELGRRMASVEIDNRSVIRSPRDIADLLMAEMAGLDQEHLRVVLLSTRNHVIGVHPVYVGTVNTSMVRPAEVVRPAVRENAPAIVVVHNHPSGDPVPSSQDAEITTRIVAAAKLLGVEVVDHIIVAHQGFVSLKEKGLGFDES